jgi:hypothetical protein
LVGLGSVWGKSVRFGSEQTTKPSRRLVWWEVGLVWFCLVLFGRFVPNHQTKLRIGRPPPTIGGTNPQNLGSDKSESCDIFSEICANQIRIRILN